MANAARQDRQRLFVRWCGVDKSVLANAMAFIFRASIRCLFGKVFYSEKSAFAPSHENSNNPLAVEPESENDAGRLNFYCSTFRFYFG